MKATGLLLREHRKSVCTSGQNTSCVQSRLVHRATGGAQETTNKLCEITLWLPEKKQVKY